MNRVPLLYDDDCGVCRVLLGVVLEWDRDKRLRPVALGSSEAAAILDGMSEDERWGSWHLSAPAGVQSGGAALPALFDVVPGGRPLAVLTGLAPGLSERGYRLVADNRSRLSPLVPAQLRRRADALIAARS